MKQTHERRTTGGHALDASPQASQEPHGGGVAEEPSSGAQTTDTTQPPWLNRTDTDSAEGGEREARLSEGVANLGFSGSTLLDPFTAHAMQGTPADMTSVKTRRAPPPRGHPRETPTNTTPAPNPGGHPRPPRPRLRQRDLRFKTTGDPAEHAADRLTPNIIRDPITKSSNNARPTTPNLHYLDGRDLYGETDHADPAGHHRIGENFAP
ncbi:hypothetical protein ABT340_25530 [Streptosporangium sp. NPDC000239]|uniref:hypothetical protein n=1 Tax=Streptosporangium sp. NPDC000239 TaxID=3154248 RepID=UPI003330B28C